jgi:hypothetical protein
MNVNADLAKRLNASLCPNKLEALIVARLHDQQSLIERLQGVMLDVQLTLEGGDLLCELTAVWKLRAALLPDSPELCGGTPAKNAVLNGRT